MQLVNLNTNGSLKEERGRESKRTSALLLLADGEEPLMRTLFGPYPCQLMGLS